MSHKKWYRPDIEGLRAVAVTAVILNHVDHNSLSTGFLGVDIFFVISGYVITLSLLSSPKATLFPFLLAFYTRRMKRIMPALILCITTSAVILYFLDPSPLVSFKTGIFALVGVSNIFLYNEQMDYFATDVLFNAFMHTWSLGVEEQFYLILPVLLWLALTLKFSNNNHRLAAISISGLSLASFLLFILLRTADSSAAFYLLHTRFWELGVGAALAIVHFSRTPSHAKPRFFCRQSAFLLALIGCLTLGSIDVRVATFLAVIATLAVIHSADRSSILTNPVAIYLGKISYSLYLWHWPILVFKRLSPDAFWASDIGLFVLLFACSMASFHLVEQPLRAKPWSVRRGFDLGYSLAACMLAVTGLQVLQVKFQTSSNEAAELGSSRLHIEQAVLPLPSGAPFNPTCVVDADRPLRDATFSECTFLPPAERDEKMIWALGDSHAGHYEGMFVQLYNENGFGFHLVETPSIAFPDISSSPSEYRKELYDQTRRQLRQGDVLFLSRLYLTRESPLQLMSDFDTWLESVDSLASEMSAMGVRIVIVGPTPMFNFSDIRSCPRGSPVKCATPRDALATLVYQVEEGIDSVAARHSNVFVLKPFDTLCPAGNDACFPMFEGVFTMRDRDHLNVFGANLVKKDLLKILGSIGKSAPPGPLK